MTYPNRRDWWTWAIFSFVNWATVVPVSMMLHLKHVWPGPLLQTGLYAFLCLVVSPELRSRRRRQRFGCRFCDFRPDTRDSAGFERHQAEIHASVRHRSVS